MLRLLKQIVRIGIITEVPPQGERPVPDGQIVQKDIFAILGRALAIRHVDAGSCNACELEIHALSNPYYNMEGLGIRFVASPRHADLLLVTGVVTVNMATALRRTYEAIPDPKRVMVVGRCGGDGGLFGENYACVGAVSTVIPVDLMVAGCPPDPGHILEGIRTIAQGLAQSYHRPPAGPAS